MTPRPILKSHSPADCFPSASTALPFMKVLHSPHVHFPPTPTLTDTQTTHSPFVYDRAPILVSPNKCELPERGGRVCSSLSIGSSSSMPKGSYFHPRAFEVCEREPLDDFHPSLETPLLIPDLSSESEDSDVFGSPPVYSPIRNISPKHSQHTTHPTYPAAEDLGAPLSFLPYPNLQMKDRRKPKRRGSSNKPQALRLRELSDELSLDGCLGGF